MNEVEELALDSLATGGPKEVLTEQANNNPEVPSVEPSAISEEKKNETPVNEGCSQHFIIWRRKYRKCR